MVSEKVLAKHSIYFWRLTIGLYQYLPGQESTLVATCTEMYRLVVLEFNRVEAYDTAFAVMATPETGNRYPNDVQPFV